MSHICPTCDGFARAAVTNPLHRSRTIAVDCPACRGTGKTR